VLVHAGRTYAYAELAAAMGKALAQLAATGVRSGDAVVLAGDYSLAGIAWLLALLERGCVAIPVTAVGAVEEKVLIETAGAGWRVDVSIASPAPVKLSRMVAPTLYTQLGVAGHAGLVLFSSGSTGKPKAMVHDLDQLTEPHREKREKRLRLLAFLLFDHIGGLNTLFGGLAMGACLVIPPSRDPDEVCRLIAAYGVNVLPTSPTFLNLMLTGEAHQRHDMSSVRIVTYGTEPMPENLLIRLKSALPGAKFLQTFGTSETGIYRTVSKASDSTWMKIDDPGVETRIVDGELWVRSQTRILGYLNLASEQFTTDGWFRTGDLVEEGADGYVRIRGRRSEIINVGGQKVFPAEVESVLLAMPGVRDCAVRGEANAITGQRVVADVVTAEAITGANLQRTVREFCRSHLAAYKIPSRVRRVPGIAISGRFKKDRSATAGVPAGPVAS
jgi:acyl-coenzyme A synthetase/AMP-(fatty) acid ligase